MYGYHYLKYVSLPRGHQSAVNIADILLQKNGTQTSRYTKMLRLVNILRTTRVTDINLQTFCNMHHNPFRFVHITDNLHLVEYSRTDAMDHRMNSVTGSDPWLQDGIGRLKRDGTR